jgi:hypothetical protein
MHLTKSVGIAVEDGDLVGLLQELDADGPKNIRAAASTDWPVSDKSRRPSRSRRASSRPPPPAVLGAGSCIRRPVDRCCPLRWAAATCSPPDRGQTAAGRNRVRTGGPNAGEIRGGCLALRALSFICPKAGVAATIVAKNLPFPWRMRIGLRHYKRVIFFTHVRESQGGPGAVSSESRRPTTAPLDVSPSPGSPGS